MRICNQIRESFSVTVTYSNLNKSYFKFEEQKYSENQTRFLNDRTKIPTLNCFKIIPFLLKFLITSAEESNVLLAYILSNRWKVVLQKGGLHVKCKDLYERDSLGSILLSLGFFDILREVVLYPRQLLFEAVYVTKMTGGWLSFMGRLWND